MEKTFIYLIVALLFIQLPAPTSTFLLVANLGVIIYCTFRVFINVTNTFIDYATYVIGAVYDKKDAEKKANK